MDGTNKLVDLFCQKQKLKTDKPGWIDTDSSTSDFQILDAKRFNEIRPGIKQTQNNRPVPACLNLSKVEK